MSEATKLPALRAADLKSEIASPSARAWRRLRRNKPAMLSFAFLAALVVVVLIWPLVARHAPNATSDAQLQPPGGEHWFGTDANGRDLLARVVSGARVSLLVGIVGAGVAFIIGVAWGAVSGYVGGRFDSFMMRVVDVLYTLPSIILVIVLLTALGTTGKTWAAKHFGPQAATLTPMVLLFVGIGAVTWLTMARIVRGQVLSLRTRAFVDASRSLGASHWRILWRHILPNVWGIVIVYLTLTVPSVILYESFLSYLGLGIQPPMASWGSLVAEGTAQINPIHIHWWLLVFPSVLLVTTLLALNFLGDGLRDALDPRGERG